MNPTSLLPGLDPAPLPGPSWLFQLLWVVTFGLHLLCVNSVLGGTLLALVGSLRAPKPGARETAVFFTGVNSWAISFAVTLGIAPLLFMQTLLGRFFYTATVLLAPAWLGLLVLLTAAYYLNYLAKHQLARGRDATGVLALEALLFVIIAGIQVSISLVHQQPAQWARIADSPWTVLADPTFVPRFLHFLLAAVAVSGALLAWWSVRAAEAGAGKDPESGEPGPSPMRAMQEARATFGVRVALAATGLQIVDGFWLLFALPQGVMFGLMRSGAAAMIPFGLGILLGLGALMVLALAFEPMAKPRLVRHGMELIVVTVLLMVVTRHQVRALYLAAARAGEHPAVAPQWGVFSLFLVVFLVCVGFTVVALRKAITDRPAPGEPVA